MSTLDETGLKALLTEVAPSVDWSTLAADQSLTEHGLDSLDKSSFFLRIEEETGRSVPDEDYESLDTLAGITAYLGSGA
ncbi:MAG: acyl carrier protein [Caulobacteraceae bacterium]